MADDKWTPINVDWNMAPMGDDMDEFMKELDKLDRENFFDLEEDDANTKQLELTAQAGCPAPQVFEFPYTSMYDDAVNEEIARKALRKVLFSKPQSIVPHSKAGNSWPTCIHDSMTPYEIGSEITWSDDALPQKIVAAWVECPKCNT